MFEKWDISVYVEFHYLSFLSFPFYAVKTTTCKRKYNVTVTRHEMKTTWVREIIWREASVVSEVANLCDHWRRGRVTRQNLLLVNVKHSFSLSHSIIILSQINQSCAYTGTRWFCDWAIVNFRYYALTHWMKQQLSLSYGWRENRGEKQDWLNASHFAKCSSGHHITRKWTDRLRKRTEKHQWSIVCSEGAPSNSSGSQYIKETKIYYTICTEMFYKYKLRHL